MSSDVVAALRAAVRGEVITPQEPAYDQARAVWNGTIDRRPLAVVRVTGPADVIATVRAAADAGVPLAVRCGGHSMPGHSTCDDGIVIDLREMRGVRVDPLTQTAQVAGGTLLGELDHETMAHHLAVTSGTVAHTGVAGYTLGGGLGRLHRKHGAAIDNLLAVDLVTADGTFLRASEDENPDLFWAIRGAGANFGVVTRFEFALHPLDPIVYGAMAVHPVEEAAEALRFFLGYAHEVPDEQLTVAALTTIPPAPPFPPEIHGMRALMLAASYCGSPQDAAERATAPLLSFGRPAFKAFMPLPYLQFQQMMDDGYPAGRRYYIKGGYLDDVTPAAIDDVLDAFEGAAGVGGEIDLLTLGGALARVPEDATAYSGRAARFFLGVEAAWDDPAEDDAHVAWSRGAYGTMQPHLASANYVNALGDDPESVVRAAYGEAKYERLVQLKTKWDPQNLFRFNQNIKPRA